jgi:hypothetical protein
MKMKKIFLSGLALCTISTALAQSYSSSSANLGECVINNNVRYCQVVPVGVVVNNNPSPITTINTQVELPPEIDAQQTMAELNRQKPPKGQYNSQVPGGNVFIFCSGGRPSRANPLRPIYDSICPSNKGNVAPPINTPLPVRPTEESYSPVGISNNKIRAESNPVYNNFK